MARTTSTNFTGGLDFTVATAGTDLFVKDDVQILAQAVDLHDHSTGKGLPLPAGAIPNGLITSAHIADGTIGTADIAAGAITQSALVSGVSSSPTTTSASFVDLPDMNITTGIDGPSSTVLVWLVCCFQHTTINALIALGLSLDGTDGPVVTYNVPSASNVFQASIVWRYTGLTAAAHAFKGRWFTNAGTATAQATFRYMTILESKR